MWVGLACKVVGRRDRYDVAMLISILMKGDVYSGGAVGS